MILSNPSSNGFTVVRSELRKSNALKIKEQEDHQIAFDHNQILYTSKQSSSQIMYSKIAKVLIVICFQNIITVIQSFASNVISTVPTTTTTTPTAPPAVRKEIGNAITKSAYQLHKVKNHFPLFMSSSTGSTNTHIETKEKSNGVLAQRCLYRISPRKGQRSTRRSGRSSPSFTIEEQRCYSILNDKTLKSIGGRTLIFRGEADQARHQRSNDSDRSIEVGPALHVIQGLQDISSGGNADENSIWESNYAMALYCMHHPELISGRGIEVESGVGIGGILSVVGAGVALKSIEEMDSSFPHRKRPRVKKSIHARSTKERLEQRPITPPVPKSMSKILITGADESYLQKCAENLSMASFPPTKAEIGQIDLNRSINSGLKNQFQFILGCNCAHDSMSVNSLAKFIAYCLKGDNDNSMESQDGAFLHVEPKHREGNSELQREIEKTHQVRSVIDELVLERIDLVPLVLNSLEDFEDQTRKEVKRRVGSFIAFNNIERCRYSALYASHNIDLCNMFESKQASDSRFETKRSRSNHVGGRKYTLNRRSMGRSDGALATTSPFAGIAILTLVSIIRINSLQLPSTEYYIPFTESLRVERILPIKTDKNQPINDMGEGVGLEHFPELQILSGKLVHSKPQVSALRSTEDFRLSKLEEENKQLKNKLASKDAEAKAALKKQASAFSANQEKEIQNRLEAKLRGEKDIKPNKQSNMKVENDWLLNIEDDKVEGQRGMKSSLASKEARVALLNRQESQIRDKERMTTLNNVEFDEADSTHTPICATRNKNRLKRVETWLSNVQDEDDLCEDNIQLKCALKAREVAGGKRSANKSTLVSETLLPNWNIAAGFGIAALSVEALANQNRHLSTSLDLPSQLSKKLHINRRDGNYTIRLESQMREKMAPPPFIEKRERLRTNVTFDMDGLNSDDSIRKKHVPRAEVSISSTVISNAFEYSTKKEDFKQKDNSAASWQQSKPPIQENEKDIVNKQYTHMSIGKPHSYIPIFNEEKIKDVINTNESLDHQYLQPCTKMAEKDDEMQGIDEGIHHVIAEDFKNDVMKSVTQKTNSSGFHIPDTLTTENHSFQNKQLATENVSSGLCNDQQNVVEMTCDSMALSSHSSTTTATVVTSSESKYFGQSKTIHVQSLNLRPKAFIRKQNSVPTSTTGMDLRLHTSNVPKDNLKTRKNSVEGKNNARDEHLRSVARTRNDITSPSLSDSSLPKPGFPLRELYLDRLENNNYHHGIKHQMQYKKILEFPEIQKMEYLTTHFPYNVPESENKIFNAHKTQRERKSHSRQHQTYLDQLEYMRLRPPDVTNKRSDTINSLSSTTSKEIKAGTFGWPNPRTRNKNQSTGKSSFEKIGPTIAIPDVAYSLSSTITTPVSSQSRYFEGKVSSISLSTNSNSFSFENRPLERSYAMDTSLEERIEASTEKIIERDCEKAVEKVINQMTGVNSVNNSKPQYSHTFMDNEFHHYNKSLKVYDPNTLAM